MTLQIVNYGEKMKIKYVNKKKLYPLVGLAIYKGERIYVRNDIPKSAQKYVLEHEKYHIIDFRKQKKKGKYHPIFWCELKAGIYGFFKHPIGAIITLFIILKRFPKTVISYFQSSI